MAFCTLLIACSILIVGAASYIDGKDTRIVEGQEIPSQDVICCNTTRTKLHKVKIYIRDTSNKDFTECTDPNIQNPSGALINSRFLTCDEESMHRQTVHKVKLNLSPLPLRKEECECEVCYYNEHEDGTICETSVAIFDPSVASLAGSNDKSMESPRAGIHNKVTIAHTCEICAHYVVSHILTGIFCCLLGAAIASLVFHQNPQLLKKKCWKNSNVKLPASNEKTYPSDATVDSEYASLDEINKDTSVYSLLQPVRNSYTAHDSTVPCKQLRTSSTFANGQLNKWF